jgi:hypothetical protein
MRYISCSVPMHWSFVSGPMPFASQSSCSEHPVPMHVLSLMIELELPDQAFLQLDPASVRGLDACRIVPSPMA